MTLLTTLDRVRPGGKERGPDDEPELDDDHDDEGIDPRIEARRRAVTGEKRSRLRRRLLVVAIVVTVLVGLYGLSRSKAFDVDTITVTGTTQTTVDDVRRASGIRIGDRLLDVDPANAERSVRELPWVKDAHVERSWRGTIDIAVTERTAVAATPAAVAVPGAAPTSWWLLDTDLRMLGSTSEVPAGLPIVEGPLLPADGGHAGATLNGPAGDALAVAQALTPGLRTRVAVVRAVDGGAVDLALRPSGVVHLGKPDQLPQKVQSMQTFFAQVDLRCLDTVDLRVADAPVLTRVAACA